MDFEIGDKVQILPSSDYGGKYINEVGCIERNSTGAKTGVRLDNFHNNASQYGLFWFKRDALKKGMSKNNIKEPNFMLDGYKVAVVHFLDGRNEDKEYYYAVYDDNIQTDDYVVVHTGHHGMGIAQVVRIEDTGLNRVMCGREVIDNINLTYYNNRKAKAAKIQELKNKMDTKVKDLQKSAIYEMLAEKDADLKNMLETYKELTNS